MSSRLLTRSLAPTPPPRRRKSVAKDDCLATREQTKDADFSFTRLRRHFSSQWDSDCALSSDFTTNKRPIVVSNLEINRALSHHAFGTPFVPLFGPHVPKTSVDSNWHASGVRETRRETTSTPTTATTGNHVTQEIDLSFEDHFDQYCGQKATEKREEEKEAPPVWTERVERVHTRTRGGERRGSLPTEGEVGVATPLDQLTSLQAPVGKAVVRVRSVEGKWWSWWAWLLVAVNVMLLWWLWAELRRRQR